MKFRARESLRHFARFSPSLIHPAFCTILLGTAVFFGFLAFFAFLAFPLPAEAKPDVRKRPAPRVFPESGLRAYTAGGRATPFVLLHGYASAPEDWFPFIETIRTIPGGGFVFPQAPEVTHPPDGDEGRRAWWRLALDSYVRPGTTMPDLTDARPEGIVTSAKKVATLLREVEKAKGVRRGDVILGGFSQGAMVSAEVAFTTDEPMRALVLLSGTPVDLAEWRQGFARRRGLPVFIAHGRKDPILPFAGSERLAQELTQAGLKVTFFPFDGDHQIPVPVVTALNDFLKRLSRKPVPETLSAQAQAPVTPGDKRPAP